MIKPAVNLLLLLVALACASMTLAVAAKHSDGSPLKQRQQFVAQLTYATSKCNSAPLFVHINPTGYSYEGDAIPCVPMPCTDGTKILCISDDIKDHMELLKREYKKRPVLVSFRTTSIAMEADPLCNYAPFSVLAMLADGSCLRNGQRWTVNKDRSVQMKLYGWAYSNPMCTGSHVAEHNVAATETKGQCVNGRRYFAVHSAKDLPDFDD